MMKGASTNDLQHAPEGDGWRRRVFDGFEART